MKSYIGFSRSDTWVSWLIRIFSPGWSHTFVIFGEQEGDINDACKYPFRGRLYEMVWPRMRSEQFLPHEDNPDRWKNDTYEFYEIPLPKQKVIALGWWYEGQNGRTIYDGLGVLAKACKFFKQLPWAYYCSEAVISGLQMQGLLLGIVAQSTPAVLRNYIRYNLKWHQVVRPK